jgi:hypothetical protein
MTWKKEHQSKTTAIDAKMQCGISAFHYVILITKDYREKCEY